MGPAGLLVAVAATVKPSAHAQCAACARVTSLLGDLLNRTKESLEVSRRVHEEAATKIQKAQTKRWLKNEYHVALRAAIEEEMDMVCKRDELVATRALSLACAELIDRQVDELPRAILDADAGFCAKAVPGCDSETMEASARAFTSSLRSEAPPAAGENATADGLVARLVGSTINRWVHAAGASGHALVMLHEGPRSAPADGAADPVAALFYRLAAAANGSAAARPLLRYGQLDVAANDPPVDTPPPPSGAGSSRLVLWRRQAGTAAPPVALPEPGEDGLGGRSDEEVRTRLLQWLSSTLNTHEGGALRGALQLSLVRERREAKEAGSAGSTEVAEAKGGKGKGKGKEKPPPRRKAKASETRPPAAVARAQECELCGLVFERMEMTLSSTRAELALSKDAAERRQAQIDGVQKAQTRRWLKLEYAQNLAAALEDMVDGMCNGVGLKNAACKPEPTGEPQRWSDAALRRGGGGGGGFDKSTCEARVGARCSALVDAAADALQRAALDGRDATACASLLRGCSVETAQAFNHSYTPDGDAPPQGNAPKDEV